VRQFTTQSFLNGSTYDYIVATFGSITGFNASQVTIDASGFSSPDRFTLAPSGSNLVVTYSPIPEPAFVAVILAAGLAGAEWLRRRLRCSPWPPTSARSRDVRLASARLPLVLVSVTLSDSVAAD
jgi:hypothetical protein